MRKKKNQTRVSISVRAEVGERLRRAADHLGMSGSEIVEAALMLRLDELGIPEVVRAEALASVRGRKEQNAHARSRSRPNPAEFFPGTFGSVPGNG